MLISLLASPAPTLLPNQEKMFRVVDLCLRLECPALPEPLEVPQLLLGNPDTSPSPPRPWLSESLQSVLEERPDTVLEEAVVVENFHLIGKRKTCDLSPMKTTKRRNTVLEVNVKYKYKVHSMNLRKHKHKEMLRHLILLYEINIQIKLSV